MTFWQTTTESSLKTQNNSGLTNYEGLNSVFWRFKKKNVHVIGKNEFFDVEMISIRNFRASRRSIAYYYEGSYR